MGLHRKLRKTKQKHGILLPVVTILLLLSFGALFSPFLTSLLPHTLLEDSVDVYYNSQYDSSGTKTLDESAFTHTRPNGKWQPKTYRVTLSQVTTWDEYTEADLDQDTVSHDFEGNALTDEEVYYVNFDFGSGSTPVLTRTGDPTDSALLSLSSSTDNDAATFDGDFNNMIDTNDKLEMDNDYITEQQTSANDEWVRADIKGWQEIYLEEGEIVTGFDLYLDDDDNGGGTETVHGWLTYPTRSTGDSVGSDSYVTNGDGVKHFDIADYTVTNTGMHYLGGTSNDYGDGWKGDLNDNTYRGTDYRDWDFNTRGDGDLYFKVYTIQPTGDYISSNIDAGASDLFTTLDITSALDGASIKVYVDSDSDGAGWAYSWTEAETLSGGAETDIDISGENEQYLRYKVDVESDGSDGTYIDDIVVHYGSLSETFDCSDMDDPEGCEFNSVQIDITDGDAGVSLADTDISLSYDWGEAGWTVTDYDGDGSSGYYTVSGDWLDVNGEFSFAFEVNLDDGDGFSVNYSNANIGCSLEDMGLEATDTMNTAFTNLGAPTITYAGGGGTIIYEVDLNTTNGISGIKTIEFQDDGSYSGALTDWDYTYDLLYYVRDYVSCNDAGITINGETPTYTVLSGAVITLDNDLDNTIEFGETGDEIPHDDIENCIFDVTVEGDYQIHNIEDVIADDEEIGEMYMRYAKIVTPTSTPTLNSFPITFHFSDDFGEFGKITVVMKQPNGDTEKLSYLTDFTIVEGSTRIRIKRAVFDSAIWETGEYEFGITFNTDEDAYYELTNTEAEDLIGIQIIEWKKYTDIIAKETPNTFIMAGLMDNVDVREEFCFSIGQEIPNEYLGHVQKVEIWRYETGKDGEDIFTNVYETTPNTDYTKFWSVYHISPKYDDYLMVYLDTPLLTIEKDYAETMELQSYKQLHIEVASPYEKIEDVYMEIDLGAQNILPQRYDYLILEHTDNGSRIVEGRVKDYKLYWQRSAMYSGNYYYTVYLEEKTTREKFEYLWLTLTQQEIITGGVTLISGETETWDYPTIQTPELPRWQLPEITFPSTRVEVTPINWSAIGDRIVNLGRYAGGLTAIFSLFITIASLYIITQQLKSVQANTQPKGKGRF